MLDLGVAIHTSLTLEVEKIASESCFKRRCAPIMFATGTLAQGLNLPAIAVVIAGTRIGDPRGDDADLVQERKFSQLLNAAGRAGRAGFANQGVVITIPDLPIAFSSFRKVLEVRDRADFLQQADNAVAVRSGLERFIDNVCNEVLRAEEATDVELQVVSLLTGGDVEQLEPEAVLRHTYAAYLRRQSSGTEITTSNVSRLIEVREQFVADSGAPDWLTIAAQRAGLDFFLTLGIYRAWGRVRNEAATERSRWGVMAWLEEFLSFVPLIPPGLLSNHVPSNRLVRVSDEFKQIIRTNPDVFFDRSPGFTPSRQWDAAWATILPPLAAWMGGESIAAIAGLLTGTSEADIPGDRRQGKPIPRALSVVGETWSSLSLIAGGFLAVAEQLFDKKVPLALACLPMCIKYGCDSPGAMAWFRFGVRLRRASRLLSKALPPPSDLPTDEALRSWVREKRRDWLKGDLDLSLVCTQDEVNILDAVREFITSKS